MSIKILSAIEILFLFIHHSLSYSFFVFFSVCLPLSRPDSLSIYPLCSLSKLPSQAGKSTWRCWGIIARVRKPYRNVDILVGRIKLLIIRHSFLPWLFFSSFYFISFIFQVLLRYLLFIFFVVPIIKSFLQMLHFLLQDVRIATVSHHRLHEWQSTNQNDKVNKRN